MADQPIRSNDIIDSALFNDAIKQADVFIAKVIELETGIKSNLATSKEYLSTWKGTGSSALNGQAKATANISNELKKLEVLEQQRIKTEIAKQNLLNASERALKTQIQTEQAFEKALANETKELQKSSDATRRKSNELTEAKKQLKELSDRVELNTFRIKQNALADTESGKSRARTARLVAEEQKKLYATITDVEQGVGRFGRQVGNYASGFDSLGNSVNQLTRELPAFAVSANTGFLAISNNLPIFFDQLQKINRENEILISQGKPIESVFSKLGGAIFSVGTLLSVGVTLLTLYGGKIIKLVSSLSESADAFSLNEESLKGFNDEIERNQQLAEDLQNNINNISKSILVNSKALTEVEGKVLDAYDNIQDKQLDTEQKRIKAVAKAISDQLANGDKEANIAINNANGLIEIENKKTGEIIKLDKYAKKVQSTYSALYNKEIITLNEKALQEKINLVNREDSIVQTKLQNELDATLKNIYFIEESDKKSKKDKEKDLIDLTDKIVRQNIENESDTKQRAINLAQFEERMAIKEVNRLNATYKQKQLLILSIRQDTINNLIKIEEDYANKEIDLINAKFDKQNEIYDRNIKATHKVIEDNRDFELWSIEQQFNDEKSKGKRASKDKLDRLEQLILDKKELIIKAKAEEDKIDKTDAEKIAIQNKADIDIKKLRAENRKKDADDAKKTAEQQLKETIDFSNKIIDAIAKSEAEKSKLRQEAFNKEITDTQKNIDTQRRLAENGKANTLAEEEARKIQLERQKEDEKEKEIKRQKALAFFKAYIGFLDKGDSALEALAKAGSSIAIADAVAGSFFVGTENVERDLKGNKVHNGRDGHIIAVDGSERILTGEQNKKIGALSNNELADLAKNYNNGLLNTVNIGVTQTDNFAKKVSESALLMHTIALRNEISDIKEVIKNRPVSNWTFDKYGDFIKESIENGINKRTRFKQPKPRI